LYGAVAALVLVAPAVVTATSAHAAPARGASPAAGTRHIAAAAIAAHSTTRFLAKAGHGTAVLDALGTHLDQAAALNKMTPAKLRQIVSSDPTAWIGRDGRMYYVEPLNAKPAKHTTTALAAATSASVSPDTTDPITPPYDLSQTFTLHSDPTSTHVIYLDFGSYTLPSTSYWATQSSPQIPAATYEGFSLDSDYSTFSDAEKAFIQKVWQIVAEDYAPFDVDVTTENPGDGAFNRSTSSDTTFGDHVVFTDDPTPVTDICNNQCSGVATVGTFNAVNDGGNGNDAYEPAWVFTSKLSDSAALAGHDAAHEVGHTFGLSHDGVLAHDGQLAQSYYLGQGNWFPIMGSGVNAVGQFSDGEYNYANNQQDDLAIIAANGAPLRPDDYGDTTATATNLGQQTSYAVDGIIGTRTDKDMFEVTRPCAGDLTATATGIGEGQALDIQLRVLDSTGTQLALNDPGSGQDTTYWPYVPTGMDAAATVSAAPAGTYYVEIDGVGHGNPLTDGYSDYDSLGTYHLTITGCTGAGGAVPAAVTSLVATPTSHTTTGTITWGAPSTSGDAPVNGYAITGLPTGATAVSGSTLSFPATGLTPGVTYSVGVAATNTYGTGPVTTVSLRVPTWAPPTGPALTIHAAVGTAEIDWTPPLNPGGASPTGWYIRLQQGGVDVTNPTTFGTDALGITFNPIPSGTYTALVSELVTADSGTASAVTSKTFTVPAPLKPPGVPRIGTASPGALGRPITAIARWYAASGTVSGYRVKAYQVNRYGRIVRTFTSTVRPASARSLNWTLPAGRYKFRVQALNKAGASGLSAYSRIVSAR
jgi:hypothetical protein